MNTAYERLMAESVPTGTFGHALPPGQRAAPPAWTPEEQAQHLADLTAALVGWHDHSERAEQKRDRHLRLVHGQAPEAA
ncbi:hypothetical protein [Streptomyces sp. NPDC048188]|uniref:hypothetical protein n=1 Tax=Streptomyces sp. NPDC048188 TaxID=3155749 RepID=UPI00341E7155